MFVCDEIDAFLCFIGWKNEHPYAGAEIILSSSWRCFEGSREKIAAALSEQLGLSIKDYTAVLDTGDGRAGQILRYTQQVSKADY